MNKALDVVMTTTPSSTNGRVNSADAPRRQVRMAQVMFAGAATIATLALFSAPSPGSAETAVASGSVRATAPIGPQFPLTAPSMVGGGVIAVDDDSSSAPDDTGGGVNDQGQTSGDIFTQNAQDQSTA
jgi:hypothetical protein